MGVPSAISSRGKGAEGSEGPGRNPADHQKDSGFRSGQLAPDRNGKPLGASNVIRRHLHPALKQAGFVNPFTRNHKAGNHAFRRFRNTHLRNRTECPEGVYKHWLGHSDKTMSDLYDTVKDDVALRRKWAELAGFGFELP